MISIPKDYWYGIKYFRNSLLQPLTVSEYFECLNNLKPLLRSIDFENSTPGFYLNMRTHELKDGGDDGDSLRLNYFSVNPLMTEKIIKEYVKNNSKIKIYKLPADSREVDKKDPKSTYLNNEPRFRKFLHIYTQIGLDMSGSGALLPFRLLISRHISNYYKALDSSIFENFLNQYSYFFRETLEQDERKQLLDDLNYCLAGNRCFPHFLANMMAVYDDGALLT